MPSRRQFFNEAADNWDKQFYKPELVKFLSKIVPSFGIARGEKVLDVGTGTGILIPFLLKAVGSQGQVTAIDYAQRMVEVCNAKYSQFPNVKIMLKQVENLSFASESFDAITSFGLFPHLEDKAEALAEMNRVLKPKGRLVIAHALSCSEIAMHHHTVSSVVAYDTLPNEGQMRTLLENAGFANVQITDKPGCYLCLSDKCSK